VLNFQVLLQPHYRNYNLLYNFAVIIKFQFIKKIMTMKKNLLIAVAFMLNLSVLAQPKPDEVARFNVEKHDFGKIKVGIPVNYSFEIKNISDNPLVVENSWASCGCTTPEKIVDPIMPGKTALLKVQYNAAAVGPINKDVFVQFAGVSQPKTVQITGEVLSAEAYDTYIKQKGNKAAPAKNGPAAVKSSTTPTLSKVQQNK
jgi:hypothetical protein